MITVVVAQKGKNIPDVMKQALGEMSEEHTKILAEEHKKELDKAIDDTRERVNKPTGLHLKDQIQVEKISENTMPGYGVGNIETLNQKAPWWCLAEDTEIYVELNKQIVALPLIDAFNNKSIKRILTPYGLQEINDIWETFPTENYFISPTNYSGIEVSGNHRFLFKLNQNILEKRVSTLSNKCLKSYSFLYCSLEGLNNENIISSINIDNNNVDLDFDLGYLIGFILGDGYIGFNNRIVIGQKYLETGKIWKKTVNYCKRFNYTPKKYFDDNLWRIQIMNKRLYDIFSYFIKNKREQKQINNFFLNTPQVFRRGVLEGYRFSDGRKSKENGDNIRTISKVLRQQLLLIASSLGYDISYLESQKKSIGSFKSINELFNGMYYFITRFHNQFGLMKKIKVSNVYKEPIKDKRGRFISNKQNIIPFTCLRKTVGEKRLINSKKRFFDLSVVGELFLINGGIVSHNCWINYGRALTTGRTIPPGTNENPRIKGHFEPGIKGIFTKGQPKFNMNPKKPITAHNYIEKALGVMISKARSLLKF